MLVGWPAGLNSAACQVSERRGASFSAAPFRWDLSRLAGVVVERPDMEVLSRDLPAPVAMQSFSSALCGEACHEVESRSPVSVHRTQCSLDSAGVPPNPSLFDHLWLYDHLWDSALYIQDTIISRPYEAPAGIWAGIIFDDCQPFANRKIVRPNDLLHSTLLYVAVAVVCGKQFRLHC